MKTTIEFDVSPNLVCAACLAQEEATDEKINWERIDKLEVEIVVQKWLRRFGKHGLLDLSQKSSWDYGRQREIEKILMARNLL